MRARAETAQGRRKWLGGFSISSTDAVGVSRLLVVSSSCLPTDETHQTEQEFNRKEISFFEIPKVSMKALQWTVNTV